ncbi:MAG: hypothetical protein ACKVHE_31900 [Planctomycetales bacterium]
MLNKTRGRSQFLVWAMLTFSLAGYPDHLTRPTRQGFAAPTGTFRGTLPVDGRNFAFVAT